MNYFETLIYSYNFKGGIHTKIVVIRSPRILSGILRAIFGIKKEHQEQ
ncbi:MAG: stage V sporulation protein SpoVM [Ruminococcus sp.]|nr:stage V sporulation protein SpoVM [Ruminococcus sp.]